MNVFHVEDPYNEWNEIFSTVEKGIAYATMVLHDHYGEDIEIKVVQHDPFVTLVSAPEEEGIEGLEFVISEMVVQ